MGSIKSFMILCWWVLNVAAFDLVDAKAGRSDCVPSSCGHIHQISYPFRLKQDPQHCGRSGYTLSCENNVTLILDLQSSGKFYVQEINYTGHTIRAVDASIQENNGSSIPSYSFTGSYPFYADYVSTTSLDCVRRQNKSAGGVGSTCGGRTYPIYFLKCTNPVNSSVYLDTSPCYNSRPNSHGYVKLNSMEVGELKDGCSVERMTFVYLPDDWDSSCKYIQNALLSGFEITYYYDDVIRICGQDQLVQWIGHTNNNSRTNYTEYWHTNDKCFQKNFTGSTCKGTYSIYFLKCRNPMNSFVYVDTSPCFKSQANSHGYVKVNHMGVGELKDGCNVERMSFVYLSDDWDFSCTYVQTVLLYGSEMRYYYG